MPFTGIPVSTVLRKMLSSHRAMECTTIAPPARMFWINLWHGARGSHLQKRSFDPLSKWTMENRHVSPTIIQMERGKLECACMQANQRCVFACTRMCKSMHLHPRRTDAIIASRFLFCSETRLQYNTSFDLSCDWAFARWASRHQRGNYLLIKHKRSMHKNIGRRKRKATRILITEEGRATNTKEM